MSHSIEYEVTGSTYYEAMANAYEFATKELVVLDGWEITTSATVEDDWPMRPWTIVVTLTHPSNLAPPIRKPPPPPSYAGVNQGDPVT